MAAWASRRGGGAFTLAVASGKGGTGKTLVATNLALLAAGRGLRTTLVDCDVEAPNDHLFFARGETSVEPVEVRVAQVLPGLCTGCGRCPDACAFGAARILGRARIFEDLCHGCGVCVHVCPEKAIREVSRRVGEVAISRPQGRPLLTLVSGTLDLGQVRAPAVIQEARAAAGRPQADLVLLDAPPGVACSSVASLRRADALLLVTEPTPFGLHDLELSLRLARELDLPAAVFVNRDVPGDTRVANLCREWSAPLVGRLPFRRDVAEVYARGGLVAEELPEVAAELQLVLGRVRAALLGAEVAP